MEREDYSSTGYNYSGSYPPRDPLSSESKRKISGYTKYLYGDVHIGDYSSSVPKYNDIGKATAAAASSAAYNTMLDSYEKLDSGKDSTFLDYDQHETLGPLAVDAKNKFQETSRLRKIFNKDHIGRRTRQSYLGHVEAAESAADACDGHWLSSEFHYGAIGEEAPMHSDDELW
ncbi:uncharacterized protein GIQ15_02919 [Arthroderma uncinatum]|uniref:uncharacterized protein n=1 Tax=Arthroderma uncinatum TaxID=74035 RepID=UPI00144ACDA3|nr:uncharacterized protein GIQ15_02919 [Arthroderma uncinatum]KAF3483595.1 hypothetical protein GIQ15_02919 [Arthroderma uncinatum]